MGGWGQSDIKDHPSPAEARVGAELGNFVGSNIRVSKVQSKMNFNA